MSLPHDPVTSPLGPQGPYSVAAGHTSVGQDGPVSADPPPEGPYSFFEPPQKPGEIGWLSHYRVLKRLGVGGMGFVFEAEDTHLRRTVALKVMRPELASNLSYRQRFVVEARAAAAISSDNIVTVYQVGTAGEVPFLAMQFLQGESLQARLQREAPLQVGFAMLVARDTASGLAAAHSVGMIHRDVKPANLWLETDKPGGSYRRTRILDFGLAKPDNQSTKLTATGVIVGTPHYMAPEQASGHDLDARADLFALGCVMFTMLTGELAFDGKSTMAVLMALANHIPPKVSSKNVEVPDQLSDLVGKLLEKTPAKRPPSAQAVVDELDSMLAEMSGFVPASMLVVGPDGFPALPSSGSGWPVPSQSPMRMSGGVGFAATQRQPPPYGPVTPAPAAFAKPNRGSFQQLGGPPAPPPPAAPATVPGWGAPTPLDTYSTPELRAAHQAATEPDSTRNWRAVALGTVVICLVISGLLYITLKKGNQQVVVPGPAPSDVAPEPPIPVGVLYSSTGPMTVSEAPVRDATILAIDEVNKAGGVLGRQLEAVPVHDPVSDPESFGRQAEILYRDKKTPVIFGCWTSASRKTVREVAERYKGLLFYPVQFEGLEESKWIFYLGPTANQQLIPALDYITGDLKKKKIFVVGSDYVFPRAASAILKDAVKSRKGVTVVGEYYLPLSERNVKPAIEAIKAADPDVIVNTINGSTNFRFFTALRTEFPSSKKLPVISLSVPETDLRAIDPNEVAGDYLAACHFQSMETPSGKEFLERVQARFGQEKRTSDPMASAYAGVHLWAAAARAAGSVEPEKVALKLRGRKFPSPLGELQIDPATQYTWLPARIGKIQADGSVEVVGGSATPLKPEPFPPTRPREGWDRFLLQLRQEWGGQWQAPPKP